MRFITSCRLVSTSFVISFGAILSLNAFAYSDAYCSVTKLNEQTAALINRNWLLLLSVSEELERNCARFVSAEGIATSIGFQATALSNLGRFQEAAVAANRCIEAFPLPDCYLEKGRALLELGRFDEALRSAREGKDLIQSELRRVSSDAIRAHLKGSDRFADALLDQMQTIRNGKTLDQIISESAKKKSPTDKSKVVSIPRSKASSLSIPLRQRGGVYEVMATLNSEVKVYFVVDSGASEVTIPESVASLLIDNGSLTKADVLGTREYKFANGEIGSGKIVRIRSLDLNGRVLRNVRAVVLPGKSVPVLLGQSALSQLKGWSINTNAQTLDVTP
jgi:clan AA aspartic protease (TIGR02281 family)